MQTVTTTMISSSEEFFSVLVHEENDLIVTSFIVSQESIFDHEFIRAGIIDIQNLIISEEFVYFPIFEQNYTITTTMIPEVPNAVYTPSFGHHVALIGSEEEFYSHSFESSYTITLEDYIDESLFYSPNISTGELLITVESFIPGLGFYYLVDGNGNYVVDGEGNYVVEGSDNQFFDIDIQTGNTNVTTLMIPEGQYVFPGISIKQDIEQPLALVIADRIGNIGNNNIAPGFRYSSLPTLGTLDYDDLLYAQTIGFGPQYIPAAKSLIGDTFYLSFYVRNFSDKQSRNNISFWINGGETIKLFNQEGESILYEGYPYLGGLESSYAESGQSRSSLFGQINIDNHVRPKNELLRPLNRVNFSNLTFRPSTTITRLPDLAFNDFVGIYLRVQVKFNPNLDVAKDYSFIHVRYLNDDTNTYEMYPGQTYSQTQYRNELLPSIVMPFNTNYGRLTTMINNNTDSLYDRYPPFFEDYRE